MSAATVFSVNGENLTHDGHSSGFAIFYAVKNLVGQHQVLNFLVTIFDLRCCGVSIGAVS
jgi:hypothetical protein